MWIRPRSDADTCADTHDTVCETTQTRNRHVQETALMRGQGVATPRIRAVAILSRYAVVRRDTRTDTHSLRQVGALQ